MVGVFLDSPRTSQDYETTFEPYFLTLPWLGFGNTWLEFAVPSPSAGAVTEGSSPDALCAPLAYHQVSPEMSSPFLLLSSDPGAQIRMNQNPELITGVSQARSYLFDKLALISLSAFYGRCSQTPPSLGSNLETLGCSAADHSVLLACRFLALEQTHGTRSGWSGREALSHALRLQHRP